MKTLALIAALAAVLIAPVAMAGDIFDEVEHKFVDNNGVKIHYAAIGEGPLVTFVHGFPDFWYSWRHQMAGLKDNYRVVALDTRGYNKSDQPEKQEDYDMALLVSDVLAVIKSEGRDTSVVVGHDWGGMIAWSTAMAAPDIVNKLIIVNLPHPKGMSRELANNEEQIRNSGYARRFQQPDSHKALSAQMLAGIGGSDADVKARYLAAFEQSSFNGMMNYYRQNYPREPYEEGVADLPMVKMPVLQFHGLKDTALHHYGLNKTWDWLEKDYTLVTMPDANHWAQHDAADMVTDTMKWWLAMRK